MSTLSYAVSDSMTMLRRNLKHALRYPSMTVSVAAMPIVILLLFVYVFGNALGAGIGPSGSGSGSDYVDYAAPGIILMAATSGAVAVAVSVCVDMTEGIVNRFRTLSISRAAVLSGHVLGSHDEPLQKAIVYLKNTKTLAIKTYITEPDGSYRFPALAANVDYEVYAELQGARSDTKTLSGFDTRKQATITLKIKAK